MLRLLARGLSNAELAAKLTLSEATIRQHLRTATSASTRRIIPCP
ncbi:MAG TPA: LuxR C-terminal-related transcriptional regulator [Streptosporangiaceae bacterium]